MNNDKKVEERILAAKEDYKKIPVPEEMKEKLEAGIERAEAEIGRAEAGIGKSKAEIKKAKMEKWEDKEGMGMKKKEKTDKKKRLYRMAAAVAAAAALLVILPNTGADVAYAMGNLPVVGRLFQAVTFRDYQYESERFEANVEVPRIVVEDVGKEKWEKKKREQERRKWEKKKEGKQKKEKQKTGMRMYNRLWMRLISI